MNNDIANGAITPVQLKALMDSGARVRLVDASYSLPGSNENPFAHYQQKRIGNAVYFSIGEIEAKTSPLPHMLPSSEDFAASVSMLGISSDDLVIIYGQSGIVHGPARAWWMFRVFGHDNVCVLDGSLKSWEALGYPVNKNPPTKPAPGKFQAKLQPELVLDLNQMKEASENGSALILDARPPGRFKGAEPEPRPGLHSGHIPGSYNVPANSLINPETGGLLDIDALKAIFEKQGYNKAQAIYATCGSGVTACAIALALFRAGYRDTAIYDGSWSEWGSAACGMPVATGA